MKLRDAQLLALYPDGRVLVGWDGTPFARETRIVPAWRWRLSQVGVLLRRRFGA